MENYPTKNVGAGACELVSPILAQNHFFISSELNHV
jgi:hypothetical protein